MLHLFFVFVFLSIVLTGQFPLFYLPDHLCVLLCHLFCSSFLLEYYLSQILNYLFFCVIFMFSSSLFFF